MSDVLMAVVAAMLCAVVLWRAPTARRGGTAATLWCALAALAAGQQLQVLWAYRAVEAAIGVPGSAATVKHVFALLSAAYVRSLVGSLAGERLGRFRRVELPLLAVALLVGSFTVWPPPAVPAGLASRAEFYGPGPGVILPWAAFLGYLSWALGSAALLCWRHRRYAASTSLRRGLQMVAAGTTVGFGYVALKVVIELAWTRGDASNLTAVDADLEALILGTSVTLCALGSTTEALAERGAQLALAYRTSRSLRRLRPLWAEVYDAAAHLALLPADSPATRYNSEHLRLRHVRQVVEIRDGMHYLGPYLPTDARKTAVAAARALGLTGPAAIAAAEAGWLAAALEAKAKGAEPHRHRLQPPPAGEGLHGETVWLEQVARAFSRHRHRHRTRTAIARAVTAAADQSARSAGQSSPGEAA